MKQKKVIKIFVDILMTISLLFLMAYQVTGDKYHEWIGTGMLILFLLHNFLNFRWYRGIFKGKYPMIRILRTVINLSVLAAIILLGYSGIVMSRYVYAFLPISSGMALARKIHLSGSYWAFILMNVHLGMHWSMVTAKIFGKNIGQNSKKQYFLWFVRAIVTAIAIYGAILFGSSNIYSYMFLQSQFAMLDYESASAIIILRNIAMMSMWIYASYYLLKGIGRFTIYIKTKVKKEVAHAAIYIIIALIMVIISIVNIPKGQSSTSWSSIDKETITIYTCEV